MIEGPAPETPLALQLRETALDHVSYLVRSRRLELPRVLPHSDLNAARLPIPPRPHMICDLVGGGRIRNRADDVKGKIRLF